MNPLIPMLAITGQPIRDRMAEVFGKYRQVGIQQVILYPRSGCGFAYPSDEWFDFSVMFVELAVSFGIKVWLYDDFNWPSGQMFGHLVRENPDFASKYLKFDADFRFSVCTDARYADVLSDECTTQFIAQTHQRYYDLLGKYFGSDVLGFFTDEPSFSYGASPQEGYTVLPYYNGIAEDYSACFGCDLYDDIRSSREYLSKYYSLLGDRYRKNYIDKINTFCVSHGVVMTGHMLDESILWKSVRCSGSVIKMLEGMSLPGIDEIYTYTSLDKIEWETLAAVRYATRDGRHGLAELFALGPADMPLGRWKQMIRLVTLFGVDHYVLTVSAVDARGNTIKGGYYNPNNYMQPYFDAYLSLGKFAEETAKLAARKAVPTVQVVYPAAIAAESILTPEKRHALEKDYISCLQLLTARQLDWEIICESDEPSAPVVITPEALSRAGDIILGLIPPKPYFTDCSGKLLDHVLVKRFSDGGFAALNLKNTGSCRILIHSGSSVFPATLHDFGIITDDQLCNEEYETAAIISPDFACRAAGMNSLRAHTALGEFSFEASEDTDIFLTVRTYENEGTVFFDRKAVSTSMPCDTMTDGFRQLYACTDVFHLAKGKHTVSCQMRDYRYLPSVLIQGRFLTDGHTISPMHDCCSLDEVRSGLPQYTGDLVLSQTITVPESDRQLYISCDLGGMYTKVSINGIYIGELISDPYILPIDRSLYGRTVQLQLDIYTPVSRMFGDIRLYRDLERLGWAKYFEELVTPGKYSELHAGSIVFLREK